MMGSPETPSGGTGGKLQYLTTYSVEVYIVLHISRIDACWFAVIL